MADITAIYTRFVQTSTATFELVAPEISEMMRRREAVLDRGLPYLVAELEGYIVGFGLALAVPSSRRLSFHGGRLDLRPS